MRDQGKDSDWTRRAAGPRSSASCVRRHLAHARTPSPPRTQASEHSLMLTFPTLRTGSHTESSHDSRIACRMHRGPIPPPSDLPASKLRLYCIHQLQRSRRSRARTVHTACGRCRVFNRAGLAVAAKSSKNASTDTFPSILARVEDGIETREARFVGPPHTHAECLPAHSLFMVRMDKWGALFVFLRAQSTERKGKSIWTRMYTVSNPSAPSIIQRKSQVHILRLRRVPSPRSSLARPSDALTPNVSTGQRRRAIATQNATRPRPPPPFHTRAPGRDPLDRTGTLSRIACQFPVPDAGRGPSFLSFLFPMKKVPAGSCGCRSGIIKDLEPEFKVRVYLVPSLRGRAVVSEDGGGSVFFGPLFPVVTRQ
ncbi:hypothetical protein EW146_g7444 [Bondarzewia mesenterica]|uniref:Uncharacterized protein n=1 Tax=Bondarzewia mesenterica TaxID=1095465 RepID=A0A4V3XE95_9AGAM|nr:hypothetical protein EW146_g7444 [Bondarzewia mesenterica]